MSGQVLDVVVRAVTGASACLLAGLLPVTWVLLRTSGAPANGGLDRAVRRLRQVLALAALLTVVCGAVATWRLLFVLPFEQLGTLGALLGSDVASWTLLRLPLGAGLLAVLAALPRSGVLPSTTWWLGWGGMAALLLLTLPMTGHAGSAGAAGTAVQLLHLLAGSVWAGGVAALAVVVPVAVRRSPDTDAAAGLLRAARAFSRLAVVAVAVTVATGVLVGWLEQIDLSAAPSTAWAEAALAKGWLFASVLAAGALNHTVLLRRLDRGPAAARPGEGATVLLTSVSLEVVLGLGLLLAAAVLVTVPQP